MLITKGEEGKSVYIAVYVDDILITSAHEVEIDKVKRYLHELFTIKYLGSVKYFLGIEIARSNQGMILTQRKYILDMINDASLSNAKTAPSPFAAGTNIIE